MAFSVPSASRSDKADSHGLSHQVATYIKALIDFLSDEELLEARESANLARFVTCRDVFVLGWV